MAAWDRTVWYPSWNPSSWNNELETLSEEEKFNLENTPLQKAKLLLFLIDRLSSDSQPHTWETIDPLLVRLFPKVEYVKQQQKYYQSSPMLWRVVLSYTEQSTPITDSLRQGKKFRMTKSRTNWWNMAVNAAFRRSIPYGSAQDDLAFFKLSYPQMHAILQQGILSAPPNPKNLILFRGQSDFQPWNETLQVGKIVRPTSIISTSLRVEYGYLNKNEQTKEWCCLFVIVVPKGNRCTMFVDPPLQDLMEVIVAADTPLKVMAMHTVKITVPHEPSQTASLNVTYFRVVKTAKSKSKQNH